MSKFLQCGPTSKYFIVPQQLFEALRDLDSMLQKQKKVISSSLQIRAEASVSYDR